MTTLLNLHELTQGNPANQGAQNDNNLVLAALARGHVTHVVEPHPTSANRGDLAEL